MNHRRPGAPPTIAVAMLVVGLLVGILGTYLAVPSLETTAGAGLKGTIIIGDLVAMTGDLASAGARDKVAVDMAIRDINNWLQSAGQVYSFAVDHEDTATDPTVALQKMQTLASQGVRVYIGPEWSGGATALLPYANSNHLVMISEASASVRLSIPNDYLFRLVPADDAQAKALARLQIQQGIQALAVLHRNDAYGNGLATCVEDDFKALGGTILTDQQYDTASVDYSPQLFAIKSAVDPAIAQRGADHVAIELISNEEGGVVLQQAQSSYPSLLNLLWFGCGGQAQLDPFVTTAAAPAMKVKLISTGYSPSGGSKLQDFVTKFQQASGLSPNSYTAGAYDGTWVAALSIIAAGKNDGAAVQKILPSVANNYFGPSGWPNLNVNGDRAIANYLIWAVEKLSNGTAAWVQVGTWDCAADRVDFLQQP
jgi:branched-chain amino acid transport system substrate-binding protein